MVAFKAYLDNLPVSKCLILSNLQSLFFGLYTLAGSRNQDMGAFWGPKPPIPGEVPWWDLRQHLCADALRRRPPQGGDVSIGGGRDKLKKSMFCFQTWQNGPSPPSLFPSHLPFFLLSFLSPNAPQHPLLPGPRIEAAVICLCRIMSQISQSLLNSDPHYCLHTHVYTLSGFVSQVYNSDPVFLLLFSNKPFFQLATGLLKMPCSYSSS